MKLRSQWSKNYHILFPPDLMFSENNPLVLTGSTERRFFFLASSAANLPLLKFGD